MLVVQNVHSCAQDLALHFSLREWPEEIVKQPKRRQMTTKNALKAVFDAYMRHLGSVCGCPYNHFCISKNVCLHYWRSSVHIPVLHVGGSAICMTCDTIYIYAQHCSNAQVNVRGCGVSISSSCVFITFTSLPSCSAAFSLSEDCAVQLFGEIYGKY